MAFSYDLSNVVDSLDMAVFKASFSTEAKHRNFKLLCKDGTLYVNGHYLAERSPFFDAAFFGSFEETESRAVFLPNESTKNVRELLAVMYGDKNVDGRNCAEMFRYADLWNVPSLQVKCKQYLNEGYLLGSLPGVADSVNILEVAHLTGRIHLVKPVITRLCSASIHELDEQRMKERIDDPTVIAEIYAPSNSRVKRIWVTVKPPCIDL